MKTLAVDKYQRVRLPDVKGGDRLAYTNNGDGSFTLVTVKVEVPAGKAGILIKPLADDVLDRLYRKRPANDGLEDIDRLMAAQAFHSEE